MLWPVPFYKPTTDAKFKIFFSENGNQLTEQFPMRAIVQRNKWFFIPLTKLKKIISTNHDQVHQPIVFCPIIQKRRYRNYRFYFLQNKKWVSEIFSGYMANWLRFRPGGLLRNWFRHMTCSQWNKKLFPA